jgi:hypothetical protein
VEEVENFTQVDMMIITIMIMMITKITIHPHAALLAPVYAHDQDQNRAHALQLEGVHLQQRTIIQRMMIIMNHNHADRSVGMRMNHPDREVNLEEVERRVNHLAEAVAVVVVRKELLLWLS